MPSESTPGEWASITSNAASAQAPMSGVKDGTVASDAIAESSTDSGRPERKAPRLAASIAPGPPPVATVSRAPRV